MEWICLTLVLVRVVLAIYLLLTRRPTLLHVFISRSVLVTRSLRIERSPRYFCFSSFIIGMISLYRAFIAVIKDLQSFLVSLSSKTAV